MQHRTVRSYSPDGPELLTGRSGVHRTVQCVHRIVRCKVCELVALGCSLATSTINHRTVRTWHRTVQCSSRAMATCHDDERQRSYGAPDGPVPHTRRSGAPQKKETSQSGDSLSRPVLILFIVRCATEQFGAPTNRRQELPTKWSSNGS